MLQVAIVGRGVYCGNVRFVGREWTGDNNITRRALDVRIKNFSSIIKATQLLYIICFSIDVLLDNLNSMSTKSTES